MSACPACGGRPMIAFGQDTSGKWTVPQESPHLCPLKAKTYDYTDCLCCHECMTEQRACREPEA